MRATIREDAIMRIGGVIAMVAVTAVSAVLAPSGQALQAGSKPTEADFDRVQVAARVALGLLGAVDAHSCDRDDLRRIKKWTDKEAAAYYKAAAAFCSRSVPSSRGT